MPLKIWVTVKPQAKKRELKKITDEVFFIPGVDRSNRETRQPAFASS